MATAIPEKWVKEYVEKLLETAAKFPRGRMRKVTLLRVDHIMDMVEAYREHSE